MRDEIAKVDYPTAILFRLAVRACTVNDLLARLLQIPVHGETAIIIVI